MPKGLRPVTIFVDEEPAPSGLSRIWPAVVMSTAVLAGLFLSALVNTTPSLPPAPTPAPWPGAVSMQAPADSTPSSRRALLIALPGARPDYLHTYITDGTMRNLALLAAGGVVPEYVMPVEPAITELNLASLVRGSRPRLAGASDGAIFPAPALWAWDGQGEDISDAVLFWPGAEDEIAGNDLIIHLVEAPAAGEQDATLRLRTTPANLAPAITTAVGAPPAPPSSSSSADDLREYIYRRLDWQTRTAVWLWSNHSPRTLVIAFDTLARLAEAGLISGEDVYDAPTRAAYRRLDQALGALFSSVDMGQTVTAVGTTNGLLAYQRVLNLEAVLGAGLPDVPAERYNIVAAGGMAFISFRLPAGSPPAVREAVAQGTSD
ncbi:MAG: alkaline phosphatase family protein, partial [Anaerolineae bacterium]